MASLLADELGLEYIDLDRKIATRLGRSITMVFEQQGEATFRQEEAKCLAYFAGQTGQVIDCGGGIVLNEDNRTLLKANRTILLTASSATLVARLAYVSNRPLLSAKLSRKEQLANLDEQRTPLYEQCSPIHINTDDMTPEAVVAKICELIGPGEPS